jgi:hypothetical protein
MLRAENYVYFLTVSGFFIGTVFSVLNFNNVEEILLFSIAITFFFYLFAHVALTYFVNFGSLRKLVFDKAKYEKISDFFIKDLDVREQKIKQNIAHIREMYEDIPLEKNIPLKKV